MQITSILDGRTDIGDSLSSAKELMYELDDFELKRKVRTSRVPKGTNFGVKQFGTFSKNQVFC